MSSAPLRVTLPVSDAPKAGRDPMEVRWGIQCAVRDKPADASRAGLTQVPFGEFFPVARFRRVREIHSTDDNPNFPREEIVMATADEAEAYLGEMLGGKDGSGFPDPKKPDFGVRFAFRGDTDVAKLAVLSAVLLPSLPSIRAMAKARKMANPIGDACPGDDNPEFSNRTQCPACWAKWMASDLCSAHIASVLETGMDVEEVDPQTGELSSRNVMPAESDLAIARKTVSDVLSVGITSLQRVWETIVGELEKGERRGIDEYQQRLRADVHGTKPQDKQVELMRQFGNAAAIGKGGSNNDELMALLVQSQLETRELLAQVLGNRTAAPVATPEKKTGGK